MTRRSIRWEDAIAWCTVCWKMFAKADTCPYCGTRHKEVTSAHL